MANHPNRRILIVDDNAAIHQDFRKILDVSASANTTAASASEAALFDDEPAATPTAPQNIAAAHTEEIDYSIDSAMQGQQALEQVIAARKEELPYAMAFLDVRMPPGWDGIETARRLWEAEPDLQIVLCTAFSDYSWQETVAALGRTDRLLILKKPFDRVEVCQLASALTEKWNVTQRERENLRTATRAEMEARAYASSLETTNLALESSWAQSERELARRRAFFLDLAASVLAPAQLLLLRQVETNKLESGDPTQLRRLERLLDPALAVVSAINATLEFASIEAGAASPNWSTTDPRQLATELCAGADAAAKARGVTLKLEVDQDTAPAIETDPARLRRVLDELVANALRHTPRGTVSLHVANDPDIPSAVRFIVQDESGGITDDALAHLFEPFNPAATRSATPRAGLGLALCKRTTALLKGRISGENQRNGAQFTLSLPLRARPGS